jgi:hypothetical protein
MSGLFLRNRKTRKRKNTKLNLLASLPCETCWIIKLKYRLEHIIEKSAMVNYSESDGYFNALDPGIGRGKDVPLWANYYLGASTSALEPLKAFKDVINLPASGIENVEFGFISPDHWQSVPKELFTEMKRLGDLNIRSFVKEGKPSPITLHAPIQGIEPSGFDQQQGRWSEEKRAHDEVFLKDVVDKAAMLGPNVPIAIHGSHIDSQLAQWDPNNGELKKDKQGNPELYWMQIVDPESGKIGRVEKKEVFYPGQKEPVLLTPREQLRTHNERQWRDSVSQLSDYDKEIKRMHAVREQYGFEESDIAMMRRRLETATKETFSNAMKTLKMAAESKIIADKDERKRYEDLYKEFQKKQADFARSPDTAGTDALKFLKASSEAAIPTYLPWEDFAREKAAVTFANLAVHSIGAAKREGLKPEQAPVLAIENVYPQAAFGTGETLKQLIKTSREQFEQIAPQKLGISKDEAKKLGDRIIGATWDIGHINMARKFLEQGMSPEQAQTAILEESRKIAKDIRHVQISDNFGFDDAHMAPGTGNVPIKEFMGMLQKEGDMRYPIRSIVEAGKHAGVWQENPTIRTLQYFNTPVYGFQKAPNWGEMSHNYFMGTGGYSGGYGTILPPVHFSEYGSGWTQLPTALGAPLPGQEKARFGGTPMS